MWKPYENNCLLGKIFIIFNILSLVHGADGDGFHSAPTSTNPGDALRVTQNRGHGATFSSGLMKIAGAYLGGGGNKPQKIGAYSTIWSVLSGGSGKTYGQGHGYSGQQGHGYSGQQHSGAKPPSMIGKLVGALLGTSQKHSPPLVTGYTKPSTNNNLYTPQQTQYNSAYPGSHQQHPQGNGFPLGPINNFPPRLSNHYDYRFGEAASYYNGGN